jgi:hypothetical protein
MPTPEPEYKTVKALVEAMALRVVSQDEHGRNVGVYYADIIAEVHRVFANGITYAGPHLGKKPRLTLKQCRNIIYDLQANRRELKFPSRPRANRMGDDYEPAKISSPSIQPTAGGQRERSLRRKRMAH